ncbi:TPR and ankyrin repeat-containing protein 1-like [Saccostrea echinata]|uniref:TPR and ankyrin repeat-containing protein 1-like n=1 Tax=Saccostrea echinata TaxID=191078 RepID=UPI002A83B2F2|nr:TPR and ankyrin repeat-containing protein 1-like [Saccostrea echinata]
MTTVILSKDSTPKIFQYFSDLTVKTKGEIHGWSDFNKEEDLSKYRQSNFDVISEDELSDQSSDDEPESIPQSKTKLKRKRGKVESKKIMTYDVFEKETWKRIKDKDCKYNPSLVYTEIMSFIKGSYEALESATGFLNFEEYIKLGRKMAPMFTEEREKIYEMFQAYEHHKQKSFYIDEADITRDLYNRLSKHRNRDILVDEVYVDETQDFTQAEICILVLLCQNPNRIFLTGDTAQCIMRGTAFRFTDIKSLFHFLAEKHKSRRIHVPEKIYHLPHNYRSHSGILNMASSVLELMEDFFPESYDKLEKDIGMLTGPKPVLLESNLRDLPSLLNETKRQTSHIELGAHQVILVFKEGTKEEAQSIFSKSLVMTIDRAKGLEFDDVLLFNFFRDSHAKKEWRTVIKYLNEITNNPDHLTKDLPSVVEIQCGKTSFHFYL